MEDGNGEWKDVANPRKRDEDKDESICQNCGAKIYADPELGWCHVASEKVECP